MFYSVCIIQYTQYIIQGAQCNVLNPVILHQDTILFTLTSYTEINFILYKIYAKYTMYINRLASL